MRRIALNLGCGKLLEEDTYDTHWINIDIQKPYDKRINLNKDKWPFRDNSIDYIQANSVLEHLNDVVLTMKEAYRVLKKGCIFSIRVPYFRWAYAYQPMHKLYYNVMALEGFVNDNSRMNYCVRYKLLKTELSVFPDHWAWLCKWLIKRNLLYYTKMYYQYSCQPNL